MKSVFRRVLAVVVGFVVASVVMMIVESINGFVIFPELRQKMTEATDEKKYPDLEERQKKVKEIMESAPPAALVIVLFGWALGSAVGAIVGCRLGGAPMGRVAIALAIFLTVAGIANNLMIPKPTWFWIATFVVLPAGVYLGWRLTRRPTPTPAV